MSLSRKLMWRSHASVGCGYAMNHESGNVTTVVVAAYEPVAIAVNIDDFIENVLPPNQEVSRYYMHKFGICSFKTFTDLAFQQPL